MSTAVLGALCGAAVVALFSCFTLVSKMGLASSLHAWDLALLRFGIGGLLMLPVLARHGLAGVRWRDALALALCGGVGFAMWAYLGFAWAPASHGAVLLHGTVPLSTGLLARVMPADSARPRLVGLLMIALGMLAMASESALHASALQVAGDGALLLASFSWSAYGLLARRIGLAPAHSASIVAVVSMCMYLPVFALALPHAGVLSAGWRELVWQGIFQGALIGAVSIFVYSKTVAALGAERTALLTAAVPCVTTVGAGLLLREVPSAFALTGIALVTIGMTVSMRSRPGR
ncbi:MAG TPA: DMT family transporter [Albitalea sp.]|nr:DMT family transporter [Albitalea sp.]